MAEENLEIVRRFVEAFNNGDNRACVEALHPEIEWNPPPTLPDAETRRGKAAVIAAWIDWMTDLEYHRVEVEEALESPTGRVVVTFRQSVRGRSSGIEVESQRYLGVYDVEDGLVRRFTGYVDRAEALADAGLTG